MDKDEYATAQLGHMANRPFGTQAPPPGYAGGLVGGNAQVLNRNGTLDNITERIMRAANQTREIGHKLNQHADAVHGPVPRGDTFGDVAERAVPSAAIDRIHIALEHLEDAQLYMAEAAGRNTILV